MLQNDNRQLKTVEHAFGLQVAMSGYLWYFNKPVLGLFSSKRLFCIFMSTLLLVMLEICSHGNTNKKLLTFHLGCNSILTLVCLSQITLMPSFVAEIMMYRPTVWIEYVGFTPSRDFSITVISRRIRVTSLPFSSCSRTTNFVELWQTSNMIFNSTSHFRISQVPLWNYGYSQSCNFFFFEKCSNVFLSWLIPWAQIYILYIDCKKYNYILIT